MLAPDSIWRLFKRAQNDLGTQETTFSVSCLNVLVNYTDAREITTIQ